MREIIVDGAGAGKKLENHLKKNFPIGYVRKLFRKNGVRINGQRAKPEDSLQFGDRIQLYIPFEDEPARRPATANTALPPAIFQDENLLVLDKPAGLAVHEGKTVSKRDSVLGILERQWRGAAITPLLVHRLDQDTSGLLLVAKNQATAEVLEQVFETGAVDKQYVVLVAGRLAKNQGTIDTPLPGRDGNLVRAVTHYRVIKRFAEVTLTEITMETGRLHQIRLHFAQLDHPVVMDDQHGDFGFNRKFRKRYGLKRQFLHAEKLRLNYLGKSREWHAPLTQDLQKTLEALARETL